MIDVIKRTPIEYSNQSRDYQLLARMFTALYNYNKMYVDSMQLWNVNIDNSLTMLRAKTLNFSPNHKWDDDVLDGVVSCFKNIMSIKGTKAAIEFCINILLRLNNMSGHGYITGDGDYIIIKIPDNLASLGVITDILNYVLPAGVMYRVMPYKVLDDYTSISGVLNAEASSEYSEVDNSELGIMVNVSEYESIEGNQGYSLWHNNIVEVQQEV